MSKPRASSSAAALASVAGAGGFATPPGQAVGGPRVVERLLFFFGPALHQRLQQAAAAGLQATPPAEQDRGTRP